MPCSDHGIFEPIYLIRAIQIFTFFTAVFIAYLIAKTPFRPALASIAALVVVSFVTVVQNEYLPERQLLAMEAVRPLIDTMDSKQDVVFSKDYTYLRRVAELLHLDLCDHVNIITLEGVDRERETVACELITCFEITPESCRFVILIVEVEAMLKKDAPAKWILYLDEVKQLYPENTEYISSGFRTLVVSQDANFLHQVQLALAEA